MLTYLELVKTGSGRGKDSPGIAPKAVSLSKFVDYYGDLSAAVDDDDYFVGLVRSNWAPVIG